MPKRLRNLRKPPTLTKGPVKLSKRVIDRMKASRDLCSAIASFKGDAAEVFRRKLEAELREGETMPDMALALELARRSVKTATRSLCASDDAYRSQVRTRQELSKACVHVARDEIYPELVDVRRAIETRYGRDAGRRVHGMEGNSRRKPKRQLPQLEGLVTALRDRPEMPEPLRPGPAREREAWLEQVEPGYLKLSRMLGDLEDRERLESRRYDDREYEIESFDVVYGEALVFARSILEVGGFTKKEIWSLLPDVKRRRLKRKARQESEARAEGLRG